MAAGPGWSGRAEDLQLLKNEPENRPMETLTEAVPRPRCQHPPPAPRARGRVRKRPRHCAHGPTPAGRPPVPVAKTRQGEAGGWPPLGRRLTSPQTNSRAELGEMAKPEQPRGLEGTGGRAHLLHQQADVVALDGAAVHGGARVHSLHHCKRGRRLRPEPTVHVESSTMCRPHRGPYRKSGDENRSLLEGSGRTY